ncbi:UNVERIFIED_CONTAM: hypothetical protein PYX00_002097 [Menopon gallinae]|uniref:Uncharacterized protein n=1 Tax=Menopon gallinae TaxID=328185 RepID=A0AAW2IGC7_9NEOP
MQNATHECSAGCRLEFWKAFAVNVIDEYLNTWCTSCVQVLFENSGESALFSECSRSCRPIALPVALTDVAVSSLSAR